MPEKASAAEESTSGGASRRRFVQAVGAAGSLAIAGCLGGDDDDDGGAPEEGVVEDPDGEPVPTVSYENLDPDSPLRYWYGEEHAERLEEIGFDVEYNSRALDAHLERVFDTREFNMAPMRYLDGFDPDRVLRAFSSGADEEGGDNTSGHNDDWYDEQLEEQRRAVDEDERQEIVHEMQEYIVEEQVIAPMVVQDRAMPYNQERVSGTMEFLEDGLASIWNFVNYELEETEMYDDNSLRIASHEDLGTLNPVTGLESRSARDMIRLVHDRLLHPDPENDYLPTPWAAEEAEYADDTTYEVTLREGMEWHDGEEVTAEDVVFTFEYSEEHSPDFRAVTGNLDSVEAETDLDVTFHLEQPDAVFESEALAGPQAHLIPQHVYEGEEPDAVDERIGSGPFQAEQFEVGEELRLSRHDGHHHEANVDEIIRVESADASSSATLVESEEIDLVAFDLPADQLDTLEEEDHIELQNSEMTSIHYTTWNWREQPFDDRDVRRAAAYTVPRDDIIEIGAGGFAEAIYAPLSPGLEFWYNDDLEGEFEYDLDAARDTLLDAGFEWDEDGRLHYPPDY